MDFSQSGLDSMKEYEGVLCDACKEGLKVAAEPIRKRLNEGKPPAVRHTTKLLRVLCVNCLNAIVRLKK